MNLFSNDVRSLIFQYRINPCTQFSRHRHDRDPRAFAAGVSLANRTIKLSKPTRPPESSCFGAARLPHG
jgi:hypothetical protein